MWCCRENCRIGRGLSVNTVKKAYALCRHLADLGIAPIQSFTSTMKRLQLGVASALQPATAATRPACRQRTKQDQRAVRKVETVGLEETAPALGLPRTHWLDGSTHVAASAVCGAVSRRERYRLQATTARRRQLRSTVPQRHWLVSKRLESKRCQRTIHFESVLQVELERAARLSS